MSEHTALPSRRTFTERLHRPIDGTASAAPVAQPRRLLVTVGERPGTGEDR